MADRFSFDAFLCYNTKDQSRVRMLAGRLHERGVRVWFDEWEIKTGDVPFLSNERGLEHSCTLILCMTPHTFDSDWVSLERRTILFRDPSNKGRRFIPLLLADCEVPETLRHFKYLDYRDENDEQAFAKLLADCRPAPAQPSTTRPERKFEGHEGRVNGLVISPNGKWAASCGLDSKIKIWELHHGECLHTLEGHSDNVYAVAITPDGGRIISASYDRTLCVWNAQTGRLLRTLSGHADAVRSVAALPDSQTILSGSRDRTLKLWDLNSGKCLHTIRGHHSEIFCVAVTRDGKKAVAGGWKGEIKVWSLATYECLMALNGHARDVNSIQITSDEQCVISGSNDKTVKVWDFDSGDCITIFEGHKDIVSAVVLSHDNALIASAGYNDNTVRVWKLKSKTCALEIYGPAASFVAFYPDRSRLLVGTVNGEIHVYRLPQTLAIEPVNANAQYTNAKVVLLGESKVGKTGLARRLIKDEFVPTSSTHAMEIGRLELPLSIARNVEREVLLWDLAGQEEYRIVNQLFLEETALAILLIDPLKKDPIAETGHWLKALQSAVGDQRKLAKLLVAARADRGKMKMSPQKITAFLQRNGFDDEPLATSAKTGDNCSDHRNHGRPSALKKLIAKHIPWDSLPSITTSELLRKLKNAVFAMKAEENIRLLRFSELMQRLRHDLAPETFDEAEVRTAVTLLANYGLVMPLQFGDLVLLQPEVLNGYATAVIRAASTQPDGMGCVAEQDIFGRNIDFTNVEPLSKADEELLLRAMMQIFLSKSLCIEEKTSRGRQLVFPSRLRAGGRIHKHDEVLVSYSFAGDLDIVYATLVVRLWHSGSFEDKKLWQNGAEFKTKEGQIAGLVKKNNGKDNGTIKVFFDHKAPVKFKVRISEYVRQHLLKFDHNLRRDRHYACPNCGDPVEDLEAVRKRISAQKDFIVCKTCHKRVPFWDDIEDRIDSKESVEELAGSVYQMDNVAGQKLDRQAREQQLIGDITSICAIANQIYRSTSMFDYGIDGEIEFKDDNGVPSGKKIYVQLKSGDSYLRRRTHDQNTVFSVKKRRHLDYWINQPCEVYLIIRKSGGEMVWMNVTKYLQDRDDKESLQIVFEGSKLDAREILRVRALFFP